MKVLIVDDEAHVRKALKLIIDWASYEVEVILEAENGIQALEIIGEQAPDILFCDMEMPRMGGVELMDAVRRSKNQMPIIVVSGYDSFQYTRAALRAQGVDYILKPFKKREVIDAFEKAVDLVLSSQGDRDLSGQAFARWLTGDPYYAKADQLRFQEIEIPTPCYVALLVPLDGALWTEGLLSQVVRQVCPDAQIYSADGGFFVLLLGVERAAQELELKNQFLSFTSGSPEKPEDLRAAVIRLRRKLLEIDVLHPREPVPNKTESAEKLPYFGDFSLLLHTAALEQNQALVKSVMEDFSRAVYKAGSLTLRKLQYYTAEVNLLLQKILGSAEEGPGNTALLLWTLNFDQWVRQVTDLLANVGCPCGEPRTASVAGMVRTYISGHLNEKITLLDLSKKFYLTPQYLSKVYKEAFGSTIIGDINTLRMKAAKEMLANSNKRILDIALALGFDDENYFSRVFRKAEGLSPNQFRKDCEAGLVSDCAMK